MLCYLEAELLNHRADSLFSAEPFCRLSAHSQRDPFHKTIFTNICITFYSCGNCKIVYPVDMIFCLRQLHCIWYLSTSVRRSIQLGGLGFGTY